MSHTIVFGGHLSGKPDQTCRRTDPDFPTAASRGDDGMILVIRVKGPLVGVANPATVIKWGAMRF